ncbi:MAG TPA: fumarylacetoacetate hydrolase family protein [Candidatus Binataceae bacterium]
MISPSDLDDAVASMLDARSSRRALTRVPPSGAPLALDDAYAVQERFVEAFVREHKARVVGYKIGCASKESQTLVGASGPFAARIFSATRFDSPAAIQARDFFTLGVEAEFAFTMRTELPPRRTPYERAEVARAIASVAPVIELCDTRLVNWKAARIEEIIADNGFHGGLVVGRKIEQWQSIDLARHEAILSIGDEVRGRGSAAGSLGDPFDGMVWIANELSRRGHGLAAGDIVATGTFTGLHFVHEPAPIVADFGSAGRVEVEVRP